MNTSEDKKLMAEQSSDGLFKVPIPRKRSAFKPVTPLVSSEQKNPRFLPKDYVIKRQKLRLVKLLWKLVQSPGSLTKSERMILMSHPVVRGLISYSKSNNWGPWTFYVPLDNLLEAVLSDETVYEECDWVNKCYSNNQSQSHLKKVDDSVKHQDANPTAGTAKKIGFYTQAERLFKIKKYKQKVKKWLTKKKVPKVSPESPLCSDNKFDWQKTEARTPEKAALGDLNPEMGKPRVMQSQSCFRQFMHDFASSPGGQNLNDIVAQLSGFN